MNAQERLEKRQAELQTFEGLEKWMKEIHEGKRLTQRLVPEISELKSTTTDESKRFAALMLCALELGATADQACKSASMVIANFDPQKILGEVAKKIG